MRKIFRLIVVTQSQWNFSSDIRQREIFLPVVRVHANICVQISPDETLHVVRRGIIGCTNRSILHHVESRKNDLKVRSKKSNIDRLFFPIIIKICSKKNSYDFKLYSFSNRRRIEFSKDGKKEDSIERRQIIRIKGSSLKFPRIAI